MKILVVTQYFYPENFKINDLCDGLIERGHDVTVYTGMPNYPDGEYFKNYSLFGPYTEKIKNIKVLRVPLVSRGKNKNIRLIFNFLSFALIASLLAPFRVRGKFDKIFVFGPSPVTVILPAIILKFIKKAPIFFWVQDLWPESLVATNTLKNKKLLNMVAFIVRQFYKCTDKILVTSNGFIEKIQNLDVKMDKIIYFPQWAEGLFEREIDQNFSIAEMDNDSFKVLFAGNIGTSQDFETLLTSATILKENHKIKFYILGDGLMKKWAEKEAQKNDLNNFIFLGKKPLNYMPEYYAKADALLISLTNSELFQITIPSKLQSYLVSRRPIIGSLNGEGANIILKSKSGYCSEAGNPTSLAQVILKMSELSKDELNNMSKNGYDYYKMNFEREVLLTKLEKIFSAN